MLFQLYGTEDHVRIQIHIRTFGVLFQGRIQDFKLGGGAHLKKLRRAEGGAKNFWDISCEGR
jgi:hypothetical protein